MKEVLRKIVLLSLAGFLVSSGAKAETAGSASTIPLGNSDGELDVVPPYFVKVNGPAGSCSGVAITNNMILTALVCVADSKKNPFDISDVSVRYIDAPANTLEKKKYAVKSITESRDGGVALVELREKKDLIHYPYALPFLSNAHFEAQASLMGLPYWRGAHLYGFGDPDASSKEADSVANRTPGDLDTNSPLISSPNCSFGRVITKFPDSPMDKELSYSMLPADRGAPLISDLMSRRLGGPDVLVGMYVGDVQADKRGPYNGTPRVGPVACLVNWNWVASLTVNYPYLALAYATIMQFGLLD